MTDTVIAPVADEFDVPRFVSEEEYLRVWAEQHYEWVDGELIKVPSSFKHKIVIDYLRLLLQAYFSLRPIGLQITENFMLQLDPFNKRHYREPDIMVLLNENSVGTLTDTAIIGAADICIEIVSPESVARDYSDKLMEYQDIGVREYWIIDPERQTAIFYVRNAEGRFVRGALTGTVYTTPLLPGLKVETALLWQSPLPDIAVTLEAVRAMLTDRPA
jgi:Uma2 family endonuclease